MTTTDPAASITEQPELIPPTLPDYHGTPASGMKSSLSGAGKRITRSHSIGDRVVLVVEARVKKAGHEQTDDGIIYVENLRVDDLFELAGDPGARLLSTMRSLYRQADDANAGRVPLPGTLIHTDANGVVLTDAELAELRGDPVRAVLSDDLTPAVVVFNEGTRRMWPDDFPQDAPRPTVGAVFDDDGVSIEVVELLHHATGETIAKADDAPAAPAAADDIPPADDAPEETPESVPCTCGAMNLVPPATDGFVFSGSLHRLDGPCYAYDGPDGFPDSTPPAPAGEIPDLPEPDAFTGDLGDDVDGWETPDPATAQRLADAANLPTADDFAFVNRPISDLRPDVDQIDDLARLRRLLTAERQGRGVGGKPRKHAEQAIGNRIAALEDGDQ